MGMRKSFDWIIRISCAALAVFNFAQLTNWGFSPKVEQVGDALNTVFLIAIFLLVSSNEKRVSPQEGSR